MYDNTKSSRDKHISYNLSQEKPTSFNTTYSYATHVLSGIDQNERLFFIERSWPQNQRWRYVDNPHYIYSLNRQQFFTQAQEHLSFIPCGIWDRKKTTTNKVNVLHQLKSIFIAIIFADQYLKIVIVNKLDSTFLYFFFPVTIWNNIYIRSLALKPIKFTLKFQLDGTWI